MSYKLTFHPLAEKEYVESVVWYEKNRTGLGVQFIEEIENLLDHIEQNPFLFPRKKGGFREAPLKIFPYVIVYAVTRKGRQISVLSIFHTSRNPVLKYNR